MPTDRIPDGWSIHTRQPREAVSPPRVEPLEREPIRFSDFAWDLTPEPRRIGPMVGPSRTAVLDYAEWAQEADLLDHRHGGELRVNSEELVYLLRILRAAHFEVLVTGHQPKTTLLKEEFARFGQRPFPDPSETAQLGTNRHYFPTAVHAIHEFVDKDGFLLQPGQLIEEPVRRGWYASFPDNTRRVLKLRNLYRDTQELSGLVLVS